MVINSLCYPCFLRQVLSVCSMLEAEEGARKGLLKEVMDYLSKAHDSLSPPYLSRDVYRIISRRLGVEDPYREKKRESNRLALSMLPHLKELVEKAEDPLFEAVRIAIVGNIIDFGVAESFSLEELSSFSSIPFAINHYPQLKEELQEAKTVLYIGDNAGEVVFDRVLIELLNRMGKRVFFAVRSAPIINDATYEDAVEAGIDRFAEIVDSGSDGPGVLMDRVTERFKHLFRDADVVISKGQGNFETLEDIPRTVYFLLRAKCEVVAGMIGANVGDMVIYRGGKSCPGLLL